MDEAELAFMQLGLGIFLEKISLKPLQGYFFHQALLSRIKSNQATSRYCKLVQLIPSKPWVFLMSFYGVLYLLELFDPQESPQEPQNMNSK